MNPLKKLFQQTAIYGLATVLPRMLSFLLVPIYTEVMAPEKYGVVTIIFSWFAIFNVFLAYGMETAFFRFYNKAENKESVVSTTLISLLGSTLFFLVVGLLFQGWWSAILDIERVYVKYLFLILSLDALAIIPFAWLRANEKPMRYALIKTTNVAIYLGLTIFFLLVLPNLGKGNSDGWVQNLYIPDFEISYILISNLVASGITLLIMFPLYLKNKYVFDQDLFKRMMNYAWPVLIAGIAFTINEVFDKILLDKLLPVEMAESEVGKYAACYKLGMFMTLFGTAFRLGIEPFFFSHAGTKNPQRAYAQITDYFVVIGSIILLAAVVFADVLKVLFIRNESYWEAMAVVPLILLASFFLGIYHNLSVWYKVTDKTRYGAVISIIGAIITISINYLFIPSMGYMASAIATLFAYGSMMVLSYYFGKSRYPIPYNFRKMLFYLGISTLFSVLSFYVFDRNLYIGSILLLLFLGLVYKLENDILRKVFSKR
ncbi:Membrane protein involved in the export of O-antigen and teichoic acid [Pricia antarctica]|uniref:Membrane protein involved in the export of O-antigen and teichoic acid n=1 Tax=Pricia antarctica TaxID=641691 RepID=A0A1G6WXA3_9FLAO|nr:oligosaccharide flippase family protein [Pricia antarctica]SDD70429.1 Membrane protein involved in the export of O-antigen and teichoic acid [Pricia antarctica]